MKLPAWRAVAVLVLFFAFCLQAVFPASALPQEQGGDYGAKKKALVILVGFPDIAAPVSKSFVRDRFNKLDQYVRAMSYGKVGLDVDITEWQQLPESIRSYAISPANLKVDKSRVVKLIQDSIDAADGRSDFSRYSFVVLFLGAQFKEYGMVGLCGFPGMLGWSQETVFKTKSGQIVPGGVAIFTYQAHLGTLFHDIAHIWGGVRDGKRVVPCLYDHDIQAKYPTFGTGFAEALINMGYWDPLSCHYSKWDAPPPGISSWTKLRLGWLGQDKVRVVDPRRTDEMVLGPLADGSSATLVIKIPLTEDTYYLIENRQPIGHFDAQLPGRGVLILYADDRVAECRYGRAPVKLMNADPSIPYLQGAAYDLPGKNVFRDEKHNIEIRIVGKKGNSYTLRVSQIR